MNSSKKKFKKPHLQFSRITTLFLWFFPINKNFTDHIVQAPGPRSNLAKFFCSESLSQRDFSFFFFDEFATACYPLHQSMDMPKDHI